MTKNTYQGIRAHVSGSYRTETLHDKEYIVVPVVALVEGVLMGMSASGPELALAEEFGKFPNSWDGRPLVMSHPVVDGSPVSANSPEMLKLHQIGMIFNTKLDGDKLVQEAWLDTTIAANLNDDSKAILETLKKGEMIEVSTGYFAMLEAVEGLHNNQEYSAIQRGIVPDHLAFLPNGVLGACSNKDGCGAQLAANSSPSKPFVPIKDFRVEKACCDACAAGGESHTHEEDAMQINQDASSKDASKTPQANSEGPEAYKPVTIAQTIADGVMLDDISQLVSKALKAAGNMYSYLRGLTKSKAIFERYDDFNGGYNTYQQSYSIDADGKVTFSDDAEKVNLITKVVAANSETAGDIATDSKEQSMSTKTDASGTAPAVTEKTETVQTIVNEQGTLEVTMNADGTPKAFKYAPKKDAKEEAGEDATGKKKPKSMQEYIDQAPPEMQEVLANGLKMHTDKKKSTITALKASGRCKFDDAKLEAMSLDMLENLAELAQVPTFEGVARPMSANAGSDDGDVTPAPMVFEAAPVAA